MSYRFLYMTASAPEEARRIGRALVEERLVACVNIIEGMESIYWWEGKIQEDRETILIAKTRAELLEPLMEKVKAMHSYDCPCIVALPIESGNPDYLAWIGRETGGSEFHRKE